MRSLFALLLIFVGLTVLTPSTSTAQESGSGDRPVHAVQEINLFYAAHMRKILTEELERGNYASREMRDVHSILVQKIHMLYHTGPQFKSTTLYATASPLVLAGSKVDNGVPSVLFIVPAFIDYHGRLIRKFGTRQGEEIFVNSLTIIGLHEMQHLAYGFVLSGDLSPAAANAAEIKTWALTCQDVIRIFAEKGLPISESAQEAYRAWVASGRNIMSTRWKDFIENKYSSSR
jgi:hypothetical protein